MFLITAQCNSSLYRFTVAINVIFFCWPGTMFSVGVFSHVLQIDDALIGVMSCMSKILAGFVYAFATTEFVFYLGNIRPYPAFDN